VSGHDEATATGLTVGVIGLGDIGSGVATGLATGGHALVVTDVRPEATAPFADRARIAPDPAALGAECDAVVVAVVTDAQVRAVLEPPGGALSTLREGASVVVVSTVSVDTLRAVAAAGAASGVTVLDCGVSGGPASAADGTLISMVGGDADAVERVQPVLEAFSSLVVHMGPLGTGLMAKLARNLVQYASWLAAYEAQVIAEAAGIELAKLAQVIRASDQKIGGAATLMFRPSVRQFTGSDDAGLVGAMRNASLLAHKDLRAAVALAQELGVDAPLTALTEARCDLLFGVAGLGGTTEAP
jgi:3-hydroxyisobutyrate dehydrogenase